MSNVVIIIIGNDEEEPIIPGDYKEEFDPESNLEDRTPLKRRQFLDNLNIIESEHIIPNTGFIMPEESKQIPVEEQDEITIPKSLLEQINTLRKEYGNEPLDEIPDWLKEQFENREAMERYS